MQTVKVYFSLRLHAFIVRHRGTENVVVDKVARFD